MLKVALVTGESISISARCNGSGRGFLHFDSSLHFRNVKGSCFSPRPPQSSLRPWLANLYCAFYHSLPHTNIHPPRPARTCSKQSPAWHWPTLSDSDLNESPRPALSSVTEKIIKHKPPVIVLLHFHSLFVVNCLRYLTHTRLLTALFHLFSRSIHSCTEVVVPDASLHGWWRV